MMIATHWPALVTLATVALLVFVGFSVGRARARFKIAAPATTGHPEFERTYRVQVNTTENAVVFLPALWLFAWYVNPLWSAVLGAIWVAGRVWYARAYVQDAARRGNGFIVSFAACMTLAVGAAVGIARQIVTSL
jgi:uncharacterized membrane protein YecN with MAPEG domain